MLGLAAVASKSGTVTSFTVSIAALTFGPFSQRPRSFPSHFMTARSVTRTEYPRVSLPRHNHRDFNMPIVLNTVREDAPEWSPFI